MADVAQLVERRIVIPVVAGSSPVVRPKFENQMKQLALPFELEAFTHKKATACFVRDGQVFLVLTPRDIRVEGSPLRVVIGDSKPMVQGLNGFEGITIKTACSEQLVA